MSKRAAGPHGEERHRVYCSRGSAQAGTATAVGALLATASASGAAAAPSADDIPILGQAFTLGVVKAGPPAVVTVHGVRRIEGATILYWSLGVPTDSPASHGSSFLGPVSTAFYNQPIGPATGDAALTDRGRAQDLPATGPHREV